VEREREKERERKREIVGEGRGENSIGKTLRELRVVVERG
jgi:hypothetical protein